ncbi:hypothetical protein D3C75_918680 [compost metagenome]
MLEGGRIQGKRFPGCLQLALLGPAAFQRVRRFILQHKHPVVEQSFIGLSCPGCSEIDIPFAGNIMNFGSPDVGAKRPCFIFAPGNNRCCFCKSFNGLRSAHLNPVVFRYGSGEVIITVRVFIYPRIRALLHKRIAVFFVRAHIVAPLVYQRWIDSYSSVSTTTDAGGRVQLRMPSVSSACS